MSERSEHSYVEKVEYWAVAWGGIVMIVTGVMLWANDLTLAWLPKSVLDVATAIHFYEAVLAAWISSRVWRTIPPSADVTRACEVERA